MRRRFTAYLPLIILALILAVGAWLRLKDIGLYLTFLGDEGRDVLVVKRMIVDHKWTLLGPTASVGGFFMGPAYYYFMLPFLWLWRLDPVGPAVGVALVGIATIALVWYVGRRMFDTWTGLAAASLYALSPIVIAYSRSSWNPNIVPFFSTWLVYMLWLIVTEGRWKLLFWVGFILGIGIQLHYAFLFLFGLVGVWFVLFGKPYNRFREYGLGILGFLTGFAPFLGFEVRHGFSNSRAIVEFVFAGKETGFAGTRFITNVTDVFFRLFARLVLRLPDARMLEQIPVALRNFWSDTGWLVALSATIAAIAMAVRPSRLYAAFGVRADVGQKKNLRVAVLMLLLWLGVVLAFFGLYRKSIYEYYFGVFFALPFLLSALGLRLLGSTRWGRWIAGVLLVVLLVLNWEGRPFKYQPNNQLGQAQLIAREVIAHTNGKPYNFALIAGGNSDHAYRYFFEIWGKPPVTIENAVVDPGRKTVTDQLLIVCEYPTCEPLGHSLWEIAGFGRAEIAGVWDVSVVKIYRLVHYTGKE